MAEFTTLTALVLGLLFGMRHAFDADHLVAVSTIVSEYRNPLKAIWVGVSWGLGHTLTLFLVGGILLVANITLPQAIARLFEFLVGAMLIFLGLQIFWSFRQHRVHLHSHAHQQREHGHWHSHAEGTTHTHHNRQFWRQLPSLLIAGIVPGESASVRHLRLGKPFFRLKSFLVGTVHGLAGSAALMLLVLATLKSAWTGVSYILLFGLGSVVAMGVITIFISLPFSLSSRLPSLHRVVQAVAGSASILFGLFLMYEVGLKP